MPKVPKYLSGFNISKGLILDGYRLDDIDIGHVTIQRYKKYQYPTKMVWTQIAPGMSNPVDPQTFVHSLSNYLGNNKIIYTAYGNPYNCNFGTLELINTSNNITIDSTPEISILIEATGICTRV